jgi:hypothetical protein
VERQAVRLALLNGRLIDGTGREPQDGWGVVVEGTTIGWLHFRVSEDYAREYTRAYRLGEAEICRFVDECRQAYEACREAIVRAFAIGTPTAIGSDGAHVFPPFDIVREMEYFQELGIAPLEIITSATSVSARAVGRAEVWGTLAPGKAADVLVVDGDPARDVRILRDKARIVMIVQDGRVMRDFLREEPCRTTR